MSELRSARMLMNWRTRQALESQPIFDPASLDAPPRAADPVEMMLVDDALSLNEGATTMTSGGPCPQMPWEIIL